MNKLPNFIIIGADKSGTTALYEYLAKHPDVYMSPVKQTNFFALEGKQIANPKDNPSEVFGSPWTITKWEDYEHLFSGVTTETAIGEASPMYLYSPDAVYKIKERLPHAKLIVVLRNPVDKLYSRFMHLARENRKPTDKFEDALTRDNIWWKRSDLVREGFYHEHLQKFYKHFPESQIQVVLYDDLKTDPLQVVQNLYDFIGVDGWYEPTLDSGQSRNPILDKFIGQNNAIKELAKKVGPQLETAITSSVQFKKWINQIRKKNLVKVPIPNEVRNAMISTIYGSDIALLQQLINRDLSSWLKLHQSTKD